VFPASDLRRDVGPRNTNKSPSPRKGGNRTTCLRQRSNLVANINIFVKTKTSSNCLLARNLVKMRPKRYLAPLFGADGASLVPETKHRNIHCYQCLGGELPSACSGNRYAGQRCNTLFGRNLTLCLRWTAAHKAILAGCELAINEGPSLA
jgi:hypothetical protein